MMFKVEVYVDDDFAKEYLIDAFDADEAEEKVRERMLIQFSTEEL